MLLEQLLLEHLLLEHNFGPKSHRSKVHWVLNSYRKIRFPFITSLLSRQTFFSPPLPYLETGVSPEVSKFPVKLHCLNDKKNDRGKKWTKWVSVLSCAACRWYTAGCRHHINANLMGKLTPIKKFVSSSMEDIIFFRKGGPKFTKSQRQ